MPPSRWALCPPHTHSVCPWGPHLSEQVAGVATGFLTRLNVRATAQDQDPKQGQASGFTSCHTHPSPKAGLACPGAGLAPRGPIGAASGVHAPSAIFLDLSSQRSLCSRGCSQQQGRGCLDTPGTLLKFQGSEFQTELSRPGVQVHAIVGKAQLPVYKAQARRGTGNALPETPKPPGTPASAGGARRRSSRGWVRNASLGARPGLIIKQKIAWHMDVGFCRTRNIWENV